MPTRERRLQSELDIHTKNAMLVAKHSYFVINSASNNENPGLLIGTEVQKANEPESRDSKYYKKSLYWSVVVITPSGESRRVCCDVLTPRKTDKYFVRQQKVFPQID